MIEVRVSAYEIMSAPRSASSEDWSKFVVLNKLKDAGAPVEGTFAPELTTGVLTRYTDPVSDSTVFCWEDSRRNP